MPPGAPVPAFSAATVLLARDGVDGIEVLMLRRHEDAFFSGALVFPGGRVDDGDAALCDACRPVAGLNAAAMAHRIAAIRESYEEAHILLARRIGDEALIIAPALAALEQEAAERLGRAPHLKDLVATGAIELATDQLVPFAHWVTPERMRKRYDTLFFLARAPAGQEPQADGYEAVTAAWITPRAAFDAAATDRERLIFATRLNLARLARSRDVAAALADAATAAIVCICPEIYDTPDGTRIRIPEGLGYDDCDMPMAPRTRD